MTSTPFDSFSHEWRKRRAANLRQGSLGGLLLLVALAFSLYVGQFDLWRLITGLPRITEFLGGMVPELHWATLDSDLAEWFWGLEKWLALLWTTLMMALFGTAAGTALGSALSFLAARNLGAAPLTVFLVRRVMEIARSVPDLVWALLFLFAFGLGPLPGVLAIGLHTLGAQGKLFAEVNENIDMAPLEGIRASGGTWLDEIRLGVLPQVLPNFTSYSLWRFELNVRTATVMGFVGAGGIGMELYQAISLNYFSDAGAILILVFLTVALIDMFSEWARLKLAGISSDHA
ncbi:phosphonate ABC transporter, permease protein PhnE [Fodinicurvata fenggangensis]|uniref:phosphonate ABC transporter, permease protein PhnE n=1 Tax=Fodinicurvata fenggangensis TaxID=1121830 RepID=UPI000558A802|nr:phosphonate ABC transporter, permease protein PhnE [Fodinicurvata fenggangensis]